MASTELIRAELSRLISSKEAEAICISGEWGVGKTFMWMKVVEDARISKSPKLERYSYVSLFGVENLAGLKEAIFYNTDRLIERSEMGSKDPSITWDLIQGLRKGTIHAGKIPIVGEYFRAGIPFLFADVKDQIICIDDLERRGKDLSIEDVLGLVCLLKEQRKCKVIVLCNRDAMKRTGDDDFSTHHEKVFDTHFKFSPTASESASIALPGNDEISALVRFKSSNLGIDNIRLIRKAERLVRLAYPSVSKFHVRVKDQLVSAIVLFSWCYYEPWKAPSLEYLIKTRSNELFDLLPDNKRSPEEVKWDGLLREYNFGHIDQFDAILIEGVKVGYFDLDQISMLAKELDRRFVHEDRAGSFQAALSESSRS